MHVVSAVGFRHHLCWSTTMAECRLLFRVATDLGNAVECRLRKQQNCWKKILRVKGWIAFSMTSSAKCDDERSSVTSGVTKATDQSDQVQRATVQMRRQLQSHRRVKSTFIGVVLGLCAQCSVIVRSTTSTNSGVWRAMSQTVRIGGALVEVFLIWGCRVCSSQCNSWNVLFFYVWTAPNPISAGIPFQVLSISRRCDSRKTRVWNRRVVRGTGRANEEIWGEEDTEIMEVGVVLPRDSRGETPLLCVGCVCVTSLGRAAHV